MTIEDMKTRLERINAWPMVMTNAQVACEIEDLGDELYKMAPEIIALLEAASAWEDRYGAPEAIALRDATVAAMHKLASL